VSLSTATAAARAAEQLLRSGAFGLVVMDLGVQALPMASQSRLLGLAQKHQTALVCISEKALDTPSLGSLVSLPVHTEKRKRAGDGFAVDYAIVKGKRMGPGAHIERVFHVPAGLW